ncbi:DUF1631 domain-containing protein [Pseudomonas sp. Choline-3u-10]|jgi:hypothetical protein|uniref:DUF1631 domain-containing protein n=1 Tax=Pseudomonadaceae TaxID=135621 RepID=UPI000617B2F6|nr:MULTISPECIES: DUF1631 domain-containing protein [Pseudomonadaceae]MAL35972.1 DUF1631 domain-containing protein [Pseudomonas sp.]MBU0947235.1 DUF1631 domain-containing protein [Gammaproteobacteria bacterium]KJJ62671.1 thymidine phosphorylase [Pseudomonas sp. 10B238]MBK3793489.1 DUF1631 family protein [Stutzerimonas stutzeri]MBK3874979.1 DUF1631 family protein [Stutzerimonas stutzeri]|tara:strand:+ start:533 stop:2824 length:2292 start_codon:yes stop_codon:yes gene_type:complete
MRTDAKVVHLKASAEQKPTSPAGRLPVALISVRDKAAQQLRLALQTLFDNADDSLFEIADRATSNAEQNAFFEAMRDLRMKRRGIERSFLQQVFESFSKLNQYEIGKPAPQEASFESLALVQNDELEESVAIDTMVAKVMSRATQPLSHLTTRINVLVSKKLDDKNNPLGPQQLCEYFLEACRSLGVEIKVKLIILKLFERYVLTDLEQLYAESNQILVAASVLPELQSAQPRRSSNRPVASGNSPSRSGAGFSEAPAYVDSSVQEAFGSLQALLSELRGSALPARNLPSDAIPISSNDLMRLLSHLQSRAPQQVDEFDLQDQLEQLLHRVSAKSGKSRVVGEVDEDVINLVSMLFEFILDDRTLPDSLKALIGRLQIPVLKVAVLDKTFFSRGSHPARRLLNEIASASMGWADQDEVQRDSLYQKIEQIVARLLNDFVDDPAIFSELLADFLAFTGDERRRSELLEQRTRDAEEGRAKAEMARQEVEHALNQRLLGKTLPEVVVRLLQEAWSKVLLLTCLKHGTQSEQWQAALATMDDLIWSVAPHEDLESRARLLELVPSLLKNLRDGLVSAAFDPFSTSDFFTRLEALHVQTLQQLNKPAKIAPASEPLDLGSSAADQKLELPPREDPVNEPASSAMVEVNEEIVLLAPGETREHEPEINLDDNDEALMQVDNLRVGSWVEFQEDEEHKLRCKLAAVIKPTGKYIFVNRTGMKVLEKTRMGLAIEFRRGAIRLLNDALLFDRALESVIGNLRSLKNNNGR